MIETNPAGGGVYIVNEKDRYQIIICFMALRGVLTNRAPRIPTGLSVGPRSRVGRTIGHSASEVG